MIVANMYRQTIARTAIALKPQHGAFTPFSVGLHLLVARIGFKSRGAQNGPPAQFSKSNFSIFLAQEWLRNGYRKFISGTAEERLSARLALLL
jgi:hypothetical protein